MPQYSTTRIAFLAALALGTSLVAHAQLSSQADDMSEKAGDAAVTAGKTCYVSKVKFENEGAYDVFHFNVNGYDYPGNLLNGQSRTWDLAKSNLKSGDAFFLRYELDQGDTFKSKNCKKDGTTLKYHPDGNTWAHWSKGTTKFNNRCRYGNNKCISSVD